MKSRVRSLIPLIFSLTWSFFFTDFAEANFVDDYLSQHQVCGKHFPGVGTDVNSISIFTTDLFGKPPAAWSNQDLENAQTAFDRCEKIAEADNAQLNFAGKVGMIRKIVILARAAARQQFRDNLLAEGYTFRSVVDVIVGGRGLIGSKVVVKGYVRDYSADSAELFTNKDDTSGLNVDISSGDEKTRRFIVSNCSSLSRNCFVEFKAHVIDDGGKAILKLD